MDSGNHHFEKLFEIISLSLKLLNSEVMVIMIQGSIVVVVNEFPKKSPPGFLFLINYFCQNLDSFQLFIETERNVFISKEVKYLV